MSQDIIVSSEFDERRGTRNYWLTLTSDNLRHLAGTGRGDRSLTGYDGYGNYFKLFEGNEMPRSFRRWPDGGYVAHIGTPWSQEIPQGEGSQDTLQAQREKELEKAIRRIGKIPIEVADGISDKPLLLGYVTIRVKRD